MANYLESNVLVGDNILISKSSGKKVGCPLHGDSLDQIKTGDPTVITIGEDGEKHCSSLTLVEPGDKLAIKPLQSGGKIALKIAENYQSFITVSSSFVGKPCSPAAPYNLGTFSFKWDGKMRVYLCGASEGQSESLAQQDVTLYPENGGGILSLRATTDNGTLVSTTTDSSGWPFYVPCAKPILLNPILKRGPNNIQIQIEDTNTTTSIALISHLYINGYF